MTGGRALRIYMEYCAGGTLERTIDREFADEEAKYRMCVTPSPSIVRRLNAAQI